MVDKTSNMFVTGPDVIKTVTGEDVGMEELGGARTHNETSGVAHYLADDELDAFDYVKALVQYLPQNNLSKPLPTNLRPNLRSPSDRKLNDLIPDSPNQPYDVHTLIEAIVDEGEF